MTTRSITFDAPAACWVQVSPILPPAGGTDVVNLPDSALTEAAGPGTYNISWADEGWGDWSAVGATAGGSVQTTKDLTPAGIKALLAASAAKASATPTSGGGGPGNLRVLGKTDQVPAGTPENTVIVRKAV
jgi:hypothetical protein